MTNMSYCRFENTYAALQECEEALWDNGITALSESEKEYAEDLYALCKRYIQTYEEA